MGAQRLWKKKKNECVREYIIRTQVYERDPKNNNNNIVTRPDVRFWVDGVVCCSHGLYFQIWAVDLHLLIYHSQIFC